jgi:hypothetical protein
MSDKEKDLWVHENAAKKRIEFFASSLDAFLQDFLEKAVADDRLGCILAAARLAQLGGAIQQEYLANCKGLMESDTELVMAQRAAEQVVKMVNRNGEECNVVKEPSAQEAVPDRTLS